MNAIESNGLSKQFKSYKKEAGILGSFKSLYKRQYIFKKAVSEFNLSIPKGEIVALLGPNGAGKTTLMKMFTGIVVPSSGELKVQGHAPFHREKEFRKKIALVMGQKSQLWWDIPAMDSFKLLEKYYEIPKDKFVHRIEELSNLLQVRDLMHIQVRRLSLGERMKLELMASLLHSPQIIFLDEPTIGLDLVAQDNIRQFIREYHKKHKTTVILTSHYMADVEALCSRLVLVANGEKAYDGPLGKFKSLLGDEIFLHFNFPEVIKIQEDWFFSEFSPQWSEDQKNVELRVPAQRLKEVTAAILEKYDVLHFGTEKMPIEKVMKEVMSRPELIRNALY